MIGSLRAARVLSVIAAVTAVVHAGPAGAQAWRLAKTIPVGGDGGWDYVAFDSVGHRLFIARGDRVDVVDPETGKVVGSIPGLQGAHGVAFAYDAGHGFATSGKDGTVLMFDLATLKVLARTAAAPDADGIIYDPFTKRIFSMNGDSRSATAFDPVTGARIGTLDLGAGPEFAASSNDGMIYVNLADEGAIAQVDAQSLRIARTWNLPGCNESTGMAIDRVHHRLFTGCRGTKVMAISNYATGQMLTTVPIGAGVDGNAYDPGTGEAFSSNGDGTLTVARPDSPGSYFVAQTVKTMQSARTMALDPVTHTIYLVGAKFGPVPATSTEDNPRRRPPMLPGSFALLVVHRGP
jgi:DNA-binding beta-propeller fold protein YncE